MIRVADLVADSALELEVLGGKEGLDRPVTWTHVAEIPDAAQWLEGGEMLLTTGLAIPADAEAQVSYLTSLAKANVACIGIGHRAPPLTDEFLRVGDDFDVPILRVGINVPFVRIARIVAASNLDVSQSRLSLQIRILESIRWWADSDVNARSVFQRLEAVTGFDIYVVDEYGYAVLPGMRDAPSAICREIPTLRTYPIISGGFGAIVPVMGRSNAFVVLQHRKDDSATGVVVARQVATVAAVHLADLHRRQEEDLRRGSEILSGMLGGEPLATAATEYLERRAFDLEAPLRLLAVRPRTGELQDSREVQAAFDRRQTSAVVHTTTDCMLILAQDSLDGLASAISSIDFIGGASDPFCLEADMRECHRQAVWAMQNTADKDGLVPYAQARNVAPWFNLNAEAMGTVVVRILGPVQRHDSSKGSELLRTLEVYLEQERSIAKAAQELFIHPHTMRYRLDKIEQLTSKNLARTQDVAEFWWALQARKVQASSPVPM